MGRSGLMGSHSRLASPRATLDVLDAQGLHTRKALGQHFLVDDNIVGRILALAAPSADEPVLEIGPGIGTLTVALCAHVGHVVAVECDRRLEPVLSDLSAECGNLTVVYDDAVGVDTETLVTPLGPPVALIANLPYGVAATVVLRLFETLPSMRSATVMVQSEVADRMTASAGSKEYGAYSVKLGLFARAAGRFSVSRSCFLPPPRVDSAVVRLDRVDIGVDAAGIDAAAHAADAAFAQRRKTVRNSLRSVLGAEGTVIDVALDRAGIDGSVRAEALSVANFLGMGAALREHGLLP